MSAHTPGPWHQYQARPSETARTIIVSGPDEKLVAVLESGSAPADRQLLAASPRLADALLGLLVALGQHSTKFDADALAVICPACDAAAVALIEAGKVIG